MVGMKTSMLQRLRCPRCEDIHGLYALHHHLCDILRFEFGDSWECLCISCARGILARQGHGLTIRDFMDPSDAKVNDVLLEVYHMGCVDTLEQGERVGLKWRNDD